MSQIIVKCQASTKSKPPKQCSRNTLSGEKYCGQHLKMYKSQPEQKNTNSLINQAMQPGIIAQTLSYTDIMQDLSKKNKIPKEKIIKQWLIEIGVKRNLDILTPKDYKLLWPLYQTRIDNRPQKKLLEKAIDEQELNKDIFYSKEFEYHDIIFDGDEGDDDDIIEEKIDLINEKLKDFIKIQNMKIGDTVRITQFGDYRNNGVLLYNGQKLVNLNYDVDDYGSIPELEEFNIINYPISEYFKITISHNNFVIMKAKKYQLKLLETYYPSKEKLLELKEYREDSYILGLEIYKYNLSIEKNIWIIYSADKNLNFENLKYFDVSNQNLVEGDIFPNSDQITENEKGTNILYDTIKKDEDMISVNEYIKNITVQ